VVQLALDDVRRIPSPATGRIPGLANDLTGHSKRIVDRAGKLPERPAERSGRVPQLGELRIWALDNVEDYLSLSAAVRTERRVCRGDLAGKKLRVASGARRRGRRLFGREGKPADVARFDWKCAIDDFLSSPTGTAMQRLFGSVLRAPLVGLR